MAVFNSRQTVLKNKDAESLRLELTKLLRIEHLSVDENSKVILSYLLSSYLIFRKCLPDDEAYGFALSFLGSKCEKDKLKEITFDIDFGILGYLVDYVFQHQLANHGDNQNNNNKRKALGAFYTPYPIAEYIVKHTMRDISGRDFKVLDPACGSGVFLSASVYCLSDKGLSNKDIVKIIHGWDKNEEAIKISKLMIAGDLGLNKSELEALIDSKNFSCKDTITASIESYDLFDTLSCSDEQFDYIITNPPYDRLKPDNLSECDKKELMEYVSKIKSSGQYPLSSNGSLELYRLFLEKILKLMETSRGKAGLIIPLTFTNDKSAKLLREHIISKKKLEKIIFIPEKAKAFDGVTQAFCIILLNSNNNEIFETLTINSAKVIENNNVNTVSIKQLKSAFPKELNVINISDKSYELISHLNSFPTVGEVNEIKNRRGEFDLSFNKDLLNEGENKLLRGKGLLEYAIKGHDQVNYNEFINRVNGTPKHEDILNPRIACQQIANMDAKKRLKFALVEPNTILGNSLNYINILSRSQSSLYGLLAVMNSILMDWRFRITSSNNHVNNYEINYFPIPNNFKELDYLGEYLQNNFSSINDVAFRLELELKVLKAYNAEEFIDVLQAEHPLGSVFSPYSLQYENIERVAYA